MQNKTYLIIGASSGIGACIAEQLREKGAIVFTASRHEDMINVEHHILFDVQNADYQSFTRLPDILDGVVYCPGTINLKPFNRLTMADFQSDFEINVLGAVGVLQAVLPRLKKSETASVVLFSTVAVQTGMSFHASVAAAKGAIEGLTRALACEFAPFKVRVNAIAPSLTDTPLAKNLLSTDEKRDASNRRHPLGRYGTPDDVASVATFLLSDNATWITGQILGIDGGLGRLK